MVQTSSTLGLVAISISVAALSVEKVSGFIQPRRTHVPSTLRTPLPMSVSLPDDKSSKWDSSQSPSSQADGNDIPETTKGAADSLQSLETASSIADIHEKYTTEQYDGTDGAYPLQDIEVPETRQLRWEREALIQSKFAKGDELFDLRSSIAELRGKLVDMRARMEEGNISADLEEETAERSITLLERELLILNGRDAEFMYALSLELMEQAREAGDEEAVEKHKVQAEEARLCLPQLNMHGLWVGKYGEHGYEMINVTYCGDTLVATKVTGDRNVPKGEVSFTADLSPQYSSESVAPISPLEPIELNTKAARQWGKRYLPRHLGKGQVASENFSNSQWMEGQLILVGRFFSFAWVPIGHQVFFGRPSNELTLKMLKEVKDEELRKDHVAVMRDAAESMLEETYWVERERSSENYFWGEKEESCFE